MTLFFVVSFAGTMHNKKGSCVEEKLRNLTGLLYLLLLVTSDSISSVKVTSVTISCNVSL